MWCSDILGYLLRLQIRHIEYLMLYYPVFRITTSPKPGWSDVDVISALRYVMLVYLITLAGLDDVLCPDVF